MRSSARGRQTLVRWQKQVLFIHTRLSRAYKALAIGFLVYRGSSFVSHENSGTVTDMEKFFWGIANIYLGKVTEAFQQLGLQAVLLQF